MLLDLIPDYKIIILPYRTTQNKWDTLISLEKLWKQYERIIKDKGAIVLTAQGLFTAKLILGNEKLATRPKLDSLVYQVFCNRIKTNPVNPVKK